MAIGWNVLIFMALALVMLLTARLARSKARNPWLWGGAAFILMLIPDLNLLALIPMVVLLMIKSPQSHSKTIVEPQTCPRCNTTSTQSSRFCTSCGWEIASPYTGDTPADQEVPASLPTYDDKEPAVVADAPSQEPRDQEVPAPAQSTTPETAPETAPEASQPEPVAPSKPVPLDAPTAAGMTERGVRLYNQGRTQESIDQFTKAIALDPNYIQAWARRAEAYALLGRGDEAAEDRRRLEALSPGSPGG